MIGAEYIIQVNVPQDSAQVVRVGEGLVATVGGISEFADGLGFRAVGSMILPEFPCPGTVGASCGSFRFFTGRRMISR